MPIVAIQIVCAPGSGDAEATAQELADAIGRALGSAPGQTWVRVHRLPGTSYAENEVSVDASDLPVFATVQRAGMPAGRALADELAALTAAIATCTGRPFARVHVEYAPPAAGRMALGGRLLE